MAGSIICGVDDSESAKGTARVARALARELRLGLTFVRVVERDGPDAKVSAICKRLERLGAGANDLDCGATWLVDVGHPADRLVAAAEAAEAALIVVGSTGPRSSLLGSVSADVSRRAPCPVVVVAPGADTGFDVGPHERRNGRDAAAILGAQGSAVWTRTADSLLRRSTRSTGTTAQPCKRSTACSTAPAELLPDRQEDEDGGGQVGDGGRGRDCAADPHGAGDRASDADADDENDLHPGRPLSERDVLVGVASAA